MFTLGIKGDEMDVFGKIMSVLSGNLVGTIADTVKAYFPPSMTDQEKASLTMAIAQAESEKTLKAAALANEADKEFNARLRDLEGTAADLKSIPILGSVMLFLRGSQRPIWGFGTLFLDYQVFSKMWELTPGTQQESAFYVINFLVLGFLFGERAVQNVMPYLSQLFGKK